MVDLFFKLVTQIHTLSVWEKSGMLVLGGSSQDL